MANLSPFFVRGTTAIDGNNNEILALEAALGLTPISDDDYHSYSPAIVDIQSWPSEASELSSLRDRHHNKIKHPRPFSTCPATNTSPATPATCNTLKKRGSKKRRHLRTPAQGVTPTTATTTPDQETYNPSCDPFFQMDEDEIVDRKKHAAKTHENFGLSSNNGFSMVDSSIFDAAWSNNNLGYSPNLGYAPVMAFGNPNPYFFDFPLTDPFAPQPPQQQPPPPPPPQVYSRYHYVMQSLETEKRLFLRDTWRNPNEVTFRPRWTPLSRYPPIDCKSKSSAILAK